MASWVNCQLGSKFQFWTLLIWENYESLNVLVNCLRCNVPWNDSVYLFWRVLACLEWLIASFMVCHPLYLTMSPSLSHGQPRKLNSLSYSFANLLLPFYAYVLLNVCDCGIFFRFHSNLHCNHSHDGIIFVSNVVQINQLAVELNLHTALNDSPISHVQWYLCSWNTSCLKC